MSIIRELNLPECKHCAIYFTYKGSESEGTLCCNASYITIQIKDGKLIDDTKNEVSEFQLDSLIEKFSKNNLEVYLSLSCLSPDDHYLTYRRLYRMLSSKKYEKIDADKIVDYLCHKEWVKNV